MAAGFAESWLGRVRRLLVEQLTQGVTPARIAFTIALGSLLSVFPIFGATTVLCTLAAWLLRLNQPIIQLVNALLAPVHLLLLFPFYRAGERLFEQPPVPLLAVTQLAERFAADPQQFFVDYGMIALYGIVVWCLVTPPLVLALYALLKPLLQVMARGLRRPAPKPYA